MTYWIPAFAGMTEDVVYGQTLTINLSASAPLRFKFFS